MRHLTIAIAAAAVTALFVAPVSAEKLEGGPIKQTRPVLEETQCRLRHELGGLDRMPDAGRGACDRCLDPSSDLSDRRSIKGGQTSAWAPRSWWGPFYNGLCCP